MILSLSAAVATSVKCISSFCNHRATRRQLTHRDECPSGPTAKGRHTFPSSLCSSGPETPATTTVIRLAAGACRRRLKLTRVGAAAPRCGPGRDRADLACRQSVVRPVHDAGRHRVGRGHPQPGFEFAMQSLELVADFGLGPAPDLCSAWGSFVGWPSRVSPVRQGSRRRARRCPGRANTGAARTYAHRA